MKQSRLAIKTSHSAANDSTSFIDKIRPDSGIAEPVYKQLLRRIVHLIESGELDDGYSLPSERALAEALDLSRTTVFSFPRSCVGMHIGLENSVWIPTEDRGNQISPIIRCSAVANLVFAA